MSLVRLSDLEMDIAILVGTRRCAESRFMALKGKHGAPDGAMWDNEIEGAAAELAYCKYRSQYFLPTVNTFKAADVGTQVQIRSTQHDKGSLIVRESDPCSHFYVLLTGKAPDFMVRGYIRGEDAKQDQFRAAPNGRPPAFFVPQQELNKFEKGDA